MVLFIFAIGYKPLEEAKCLLYSVWSRRCSVISFIDMKAVTVKIRKLYKLFYETETNNFHDQRNDAYVVIV